MATRNQVLKQRARRQRRRHRIRKVISGTPERPRLVVHRSLRNIEAQLVDDTVGHSVVGVSTLSKEVRDATFESRVEQGREVGRQVAAKAREKGVEQAVFDRGGFQYHGIV